ncbi:MAG TPA: SDR family oxidoreductase [Polyangiales bacterium]|jgi:dTDP-4-dehydrorhamnose reductase|nr:SDR family oxidoreductase [Polyangiales bacterium]
MTELLVTGAGGALGSVLMRVLEEQLRTGLGMVSPSGPRPHVGKVFVGDLSDARTYQDRVLSAAPATIVHAAAISQVAAVYADPERARTVNVDATARLLSLARATGARFVYLSTDLVFDGESAPYDEDATTEPCSLYGRTKLEAECHVLTYKRGLVVRLPLLYGEPEVSRAPTFFQSMLAALREGRPVTLFSDELRTPLWLDDAARACVQLALSDVTGVIHAGGPERISRLAMGEQLVRALGADPALLRPSLRAEVPAPEPRPRDVSLDSGKFLRQFGAAPGRSFAEALPMLLQHPASRLLS